MERAAPSEVDGKAQRRNGGEDSGENEVVSDPTLLAIIEVMKKAGEATTPMMVLSAAIGAAVGFFSVVSASDAALIAILSYLLIDYASSNQRPPSALGDGKEEVKDEIPSSSLDSTCKVGDRLRAGNRGPTRGGLKLSLGQSGFCYPNEAQPVEFENEFCEGRMMFLCRTVPPSPVVGNLFEGRKDMFEMQIQAKLKSDPSGGVVYMGGELPRKPKWGFMTMTVARIVMKFGSTLVKGLHYNLGDGRGSRDPLDEEVMHTTFPLYRVMDRIVITPGDEEPPALGGKIGESDDDRTQRRGGNTPDHTFERGVWYTMCFHSGIIDFQQWAVVNVPGQGSLSLSNFIGDIPIRVAVYVLQQGAASHSARDKTYLFTAELSNDSPGRIGVRPAHGSGADLDAAAAGDDGYGTHRGGGVGSEVSLLDEHVLERFASEAVEELKVEGAVRSRDVLPLALAPIDSGSSADASAPMACLDESTRRGDSSAVLGPTPAGIQIIKAVGSAASYASEHVYSGDAVLLYHPDAARWLGISRGWSLTWSVKMPTASKGYFLIAGLPHKKELLMKGDHFELRSLQNPDYAVGLSGGSTLVCYKGKSNLVGPMRLRALDWSDSSLRGMGPLIQPLLPASMSYHGDDDLEDDEDDDEDDDEEDEDEADEEDGQQGGERGENRLGIFSDDEEDQSGDDVDRDDDQERALDSLEESSQTPSAWDYKDGPRHAPQMRMQVRVVAWIETLHREKRSIQVSYCLSASPQQICAHECAMRLRTGRELAPVLTNMTHRRRQPSFDESESREGYRESPEREQERERQRLMGQLCNADQSVLLIRGKLESLEDAARTAALAAASGERHSPEALLALQDLWMASDAYAALCNLLAMPNDIERSFLSSPTGTRADLCVAAGVRIAGLSVALESPVARAYWETHWREEWMALADAADGGSPERSCLLFWAPLTPRKGKPVLRVEISAIMRASPLPPDAHVLPGTYALRIETLSRVHYLAFRSREQCGVWQAEITARIAAIASSAQFPAPSQSLFEAPVAVPDLLTVKYGKWRPEPRRFVLNGRRLSFDETLRCPPSHPWPLSARLVRAVYALGPSSSKADWVHFLDTAAALRAVRLSVLRETSDSPATLAFWLNLHHALLRHALLALGPPASSRAWKTLLCGATYEVGGSAFSMWEIRYSVICGRSDAPALLGSLPAQWPPLPPCSGDQRMYACGGPEADSRLIMALHDGSSSTPGAIQLYTPQGLTEQLNYACQNFVRSTVRVDTAKRSVLFHRTLEVHRDTFGTVSKENGPLELLRMCLRYADERLFLECSSLLDEDVASLNIRFAPLSLRCTSSLKLVVPGNFDQELADFARGSESYDDDDEEMMDLHSGPALQQQVAEEDWVPSSADDLLVS